MPKKKYIFSLVGVNMEKVNQKYGIIPTDEDIIPINTTKIDDLNITKTNPEIVSFLDESKRLRKCTISMIDFSSGTSISLSSGERLKHYKCFWDKNFIPVNCRPIGCPIKYVPSRAIKSYHSEISKERYVITEPITEKRAEEITDRNDKHVTAEKRNYYETDGIFCSFNCCIAYIDAPENKLNPLYRYSESLLLKIYEDLTGEIASEIMPAPHWRTLTDFGGHLTVEQFRESFNKISYVDYGLIFVSVGKLFENRIKF